MSDFYTELAEKTGITRDSAKKFWNAALSCGATSHPQVKESSFQKVAQFHRKFGLAYEGAPRELHDKQAMFRIAFKIEELEEYCSSSGFKNIAAKLGEVKDEINKKASQSPSAWIAERSEEVNFHDQLDALVDQLYIIYGTAYLQGFDIDAAFQKVHEANMKKIRTEREEDSKRGSKFDVVKPEGWTPPDLTEFLT